MSGTPPTARQLLILADRAERGPLTAAEAARLRAGIEALAAERATADTERRRAAHRVDVANSARRRNSKQLTAIRALVTAARQRGNRTVPVWILAAASTAAPNSGSGRRRESAQRRTTATATGPRRASGGPLAPERADCDSSPARPAERR